MTDPFQGIESFSPPMPMTLPQAAPDKSDLVETVNALLVESPMFPLHALGAHPSAQNRILRPVGRHIAVLKARFVIQQFGIVTIPPRMVMGLAKVQRGQPGTLTCWQQVALPSGPLYSRPPFQAMPGRGGVRHPAMAVGLMERLQFSKADFPCPVGAGHEFEKRTGI